ncbi:MAG: HypC/HybG/HupF family hydrogenase formation chaperone [Candidatus Sedimenticola sp. (ex Thyasira tokunagai)]
MCLALPAQIVEIDETTDNAIASLGGVKKEISLALVEDARVGDYVLIHVGYALNKVSEEEAEKTLALFAEAGLAPEVAG